MSRTRRKSPPLDEKRLEDLALAYAARFATTRARLESYLRRKLRERGWDGAREPDVAALGARFGAAGYIDDAAYARMKADSLLRRGYGRRRVGEALQAAGIAGDLRAQVNPGAAAERQAALALARRRRLGPFGAAPLDRPARDRQVAAMLRAGHSLDNARQIVDAPDADAALAWAESAEGED
ncbi:RecX family transcriptional regulator [Novosphingobium album (ex Liu et al. 2023)]|uniref:Regulatory protein RecX n=1 Tax=Novosphingobium album (ex Liu et al. 2023) TaxID=3031130 RepID=A0ABT5WRN2_9SPHN|nr:RecX family transcriptional regulator [Novosphingobium album (ex Liu et al. 2023)]MDE8652704.1 RecX family transcriptional regulator [Novosphingobium album (ex Liu et al. 2023)]